MLPKFCVSEVLSWAILNILLFSGPSKGFVLYACSPRAAHGLVPVRPVDLLSRPGNPAEHWSALLGREPCRCWSGAELGGSPGCSLQGSGLLLPPFLLDAFEVHADGELVVSCCLGQVPKSFEVCQEVTLGTADV